MPRRLLVWDAPNVDMVLTGILGRRPGQGDRPDMKALIRWLIQGADGDETEACVFVNVPEHSVAGIAGWIQFLLDSGFRVFAKPKAEGSDIDADMLDHIDVSVAGGGVGEVLVASNDARNFLAPLKDLSRAGVQVTVLGFEELAGDMADEEAIRFLDLEEVPGLFQQPLPRIRLRSVPESGQWFEPRRRPLSESAFRPESESP